jgi:hypothetical protein
MTADQIEKMTAFAFFYAWRTANTGLKSVEKAGRLQAKVVAFLREMEKQDGKS